jgi:hypothetical protein
MASAMRPPYTVYTMTTPAESAMASSTSNSDEAEIT